MTESRPCESDPPCEEDCASYDCPCPCHPDPPERTDAMPGLEPNPNPDDIRAWTLGRGLSLAELRVLLAAVLGAPLDAEQAEIAHRLGRLVAEAVVNAEAFVDAARLQRTEQKLRDAIAPEEEETCHNCGQPLGALAVRTGDGAWCDPGCRDAWEMS